VEETIKEALIRRDNMTPEDADELIGFAKIELKDCLAKGDMIGAESIAEDYFGLEPDYLIELV
jgi:hypothetical protein